MQRQTQAYKNRDLVEKRVQRKLTRVWSKRESLLHGWWQGNNVDSVDNKNKLLLKSFHSITYLLDQASVRLLWDSFSNRPWNHPRSCLRPAQPSLSKESCLVSSARIPLFFMSPLSNISLIEPLFTLLLVYKSPYVLAVFRVEQQSYCNRLE